MQFDNAPQTYLVSYSGALEKIKVYHSFSQQNYGYYTFWWVANLHKMYIWTKTVTLLFVNLGFIKVALIPEGRYQLSIQL
jgi:hypothetical protein